MQYEQSEDEDREPTLPDDPDTADLTYEDIFRRTEAEENEAFYQSLFDADHATTSAGRILRGIVPIDYVNITRNKDWMTLAFNQGTEDRKIIQKTGRSFSRPEPEPVVIPAR